MTSIDQALGEFIDAWKAGRRPDVGECLQRVPESDRDELAEQLLNWLSVASTPAYDEPTRAQIAADPLLQASVEELNAVSVPLPERVTAMRVRAGLAIAEVARSVASTFGLGGQEARTEEYLQRLEDDEIDPSRLSRRLCDALAKILGADPELLRPSPSWSLGTAGSAQALFRADEVPDAGIADAFDVLSKAAMAPAPEPMDELDRLFLGGPEG